jgi:hypothetical protein
MHSEAATVAQYLAELPEPRRAAIAAVRKVILQNLDRDYEEGMQYGMIGYYVPHRVYPAGYHCDPKQPLPFAALASQKNHMALYLMSLYSDGAEEQWFRRQWAQTGKKLDMGKCCVRFKKLEDLPLALVGQAVRRMPARKHVAHYEAATRSRRGTARRAKSKPRSAATRSATKARTAAGKTKRASTRR